MRRWTAGEKNLPLCFWHCHGNGNTCIILQLKWRLFYHYLFNSNFWNEILWLSLIFFFVYKWFFFFFLSLSLYPMCFSFIYWIKSCITYGNGALSESNIPSLCQHALWYWWYFGTEVKKVIIAWKSHSLCHNCSFSVF